MSKIKRNLRFDGLIAIYFWLVSFALKIVAFGIMSKSGSALDHRFQHTWKRGNNSLNAKSFGIRWMSVYFLEKTNEFCSKTETITARIHDEAIKCIIVFPSSQNYRYYFIFSAEIYPINSLTVNMSILQRILMWNGDNAFFIEPMKRRKWYPSTNLTSWLKANCLIFGRKVIE